MDKYEFNIKVEQIKKMVSRGDYGTAMKIADTIDWHRVRNASLLSMIAQIYEKNEDTRRRRIFCSWLSSAHRSVSACSINWRISP